MKKNISITVCTGTTCYVMGASDLLALEEDINSGSLDGVNLNGVPCLGLCTKRTFKPPFAMVNGRMIAGATVSRIMDAVKAEREGNEYAYDE